MARRRTSERRPPESGADRRAPLLLALVVVLAVVLGVLATRALSPHDPIVTPTRPADPPSAAPATADRSSDELPTLEALAAGPRQREAAAAVLPTLGELEAAPHVVAVQLVDWSAGAQTVLAELHDAAVVPSAAVAGRRCNLRVRLSAEVQGLHVHFRVDGERTLERLPPWDAFGSTAESARPLAPGEHRLEAVPCVVLPLARVLPEAEACPGTKGAGRHLRFHIGDPEEP